MCTPLAKSALIAQSKRDFLQQIYQKIVLWILNTCMPVCMRCLAARPLCQCTLHYGVIP